MKIKMLLKILFFYNKNGYDLIEKRRDLVLAGSVGHHFLGIFIHCQKSGYERGSASHTVDPKVWNGGLPSPPHSAP
jgi:hypothetical protein